MNIGRILWPRRLGGKLIVLGVAFLVVLFSAYFLAVWSLSRQLDALLEADRQMGLPTTIAEAYGPRVLKSDNAEEPLLAAAEIAETLHLQAMREAFGSENPKQYSIWDPRYVSRLGRLAEDHRE